jgi:hypothetical protein
MPKTRSSQGSNDSISDEQKRLGSALSFIEADLQITAQKKNRWKELLSVIPDVLRHPFSIFFCSAILIPFFIFQFNTYRTLIDARQKKAIEVMEKNADFESRFNLLNVELANFYQKNVDLCAEMDSYRISNDKENLAKNRLELRSLGNGAKTEFQNHYADFIKVYPDIEQVHWLDSLLIYGVFLQLYPSSALKDLDDPNKINSRLAKLHQDIDEYKKNYSNSLVVIRQFQDKFFDDVPADRKFDDVNKGLNERYNQLTNDRKRIIGSLIEDLTPEFSLRLW